MGGGAGRGLDFGATYGSGQLPISFTVEYTKIHPGKVLVSNNQKPKYRRDEFIAKAIEPETKELINQLYRETAARGDGGTAYAIYLELTTGELVGGRSHIQKGQQRIRQIEKLLKKNPNHPDKELLLRLKKELEDALGGSYDQH